MRINSWLDELLALDDNEPLPDDLADRILSRPEAARPKLIDVAFGGPESAVLVAPSQGARVLALQLLARMGPHAPTAERLVAELLGGPEDPIASAIEDAVESMGELALRPLLAALDAASDRFVAESLAKCYVRASGVDAPRSDVFEALRPAFERMPGALASVIGDLRVSESLPALQKALRRMVRSELAHPTERDLDILHLSTAIMHAGGDFEREDAVEISAASIRASDALIAELQVPDEDDDPAEDTAAEESEDEDWDDDPDGEDGEDAEDLEDDAFDLPFLDPPGPNDPCTCGSGRKYKKCHG